MSIEDTLSSIDSTLKSLLVIAQTGANATAEFGKPDAIGEAVAVVTKARGKVAKAIVETNDGRTLSVRLVDGDPAGTRYFSIPKHNTFARIAPGEVIPTIESTIEIDGDQYLAGKAESAKKSATGAQTASPAAASAPAATASTASSSEESVSFPKVVEALTTLSKDTRPGKGRDAIMALLTKHLSDLPVGDRKVPKLAALGKNAELLAEVEALNAPDALVEDDVFA